MPDFQTTQQIVEAARKNLSQPAWDYLVGGADSETAMRRNRLAFDKWGFIPRVLVDVSQIDTSTTLLGHELHSPVILGPIGSMQHLSPDGAVGFAKAAAQYGTIDTPYHSRRERSIHNPMPGRRPGARHADGPNYLASVTWDTVDRLREMAGLPFTIKGIMSPLDAATAIEHGVDAIWVSNHGGRQLDQTVGTLDVLPRIVDAVAGRAPIIFDGGILRGTDVLKALALGADAVAIGKLQGWGMAAGGVDGLVRTLELIEAETRMAMALLGVTRIDQLDTSYVEKSDPVMLPHEMSAWPNLPGQRLT